MKLSIRVNDAEIDENNGVYTLADGKCMRNDEYSGELKDHNNGCTPRYCEICGLKYTAPYPYKTPAKIPYVRSSDTVIQCMDKKDSVLKLWRECFDDTDQYVDMFFSEPRKLLAVAAPHT